jgi:translation initiation factor IF-1
LGSPDRDAQFPNILNWISHIEFDIYSMNSHTLVCAITGKKRKTTTTYLEGVAKKHNLTPVQYIENYISREAAVLLNAGKSIDEIRAMIPNPPTRTISEGELVLMRSLNVTKHKSSKLMDTKV